MIIYESLPPGIHMTYSLWTVTVYCPTPSPRSPAPLEQGLCLFCSLLYPQYLEEFLGQSKINWKGE